MAPKGHRDGVLVTEGIEGSDDLRGEECAAHADIKDGWWQDSIAAGEDEGRCAVRVVQVAGAVPDMEDRTGRRRGTRPAGGRSSGLSSFLLYPTAVPSVMRIMRSTALSNCSVRRDGDSACSRSSISEWESRRRSFTGVSSTPSSVQLTVAISGRRFKPKSRRTDGLPC